MFRKMTGITSAVALSSALMLSPVSAAEPIGDLSIVNGHVTSADEWPSFVTMEVDKNLEVLEMMESLGIQDVKRFAEDYDFAFQELIRVHILGDEVSKTDPDIREVIEKYQLEAGQAMRRELPFYHNCGGTVVGSHWILTAAHCVDGIEDLAMASFVLPEGTNRPVKRFETAAIHIHPHYSSSAEVSAPDSVWDVALVRTREAFTGVPAMTLANATDNLPRSGAGIVIGAGGYKWNPDTFGYDQEPGRVIRMANVPYNSVDTCDGLDAMICAEKPSKDLKKPSEASCYGDSGGPLMSVLPDGRKIQYGIVSHTADVDWDVDLGGQDCGFIPTNYTAIPVVAPWIKQTMGERVPLLSPMPIPPFNPDARSIHVPISSGDVDGTELGLKLASLRTAIRPEQPRIINGVVLANNQSPADALASGVLQDDQVMMLTNGKELDQRTLAQLQAMRVKHVTLLGGPEAISSLVESRLVSHGFTVKRMAGDSRLETARVIAESRIASHPEITNLVVSRGYGSDGVPGSETADALALGAHAAREGTPTILTPTDALPDQILEWLQFSSGYSHATIIGGTQAVSAKVADQLGKTANKKVERVAGEDRVKTAISIAEKMKDPKRVVVVDAKNVQSWKAAFQVAGIAADIKAPVVLTDGDKIPEATMAYLKTVTPADKGPVVVCVAQKDACAAVDAALGVKP